MNKLLPKKEELTPITNERDAFFDGPFKTDFDKLHIKEKLQIINDIVRQTMIYNAIPNPDIEHEDLIGDSYTACLVSMEYLKTFNLNIDIYLKFAYINPCENENNAKPIPVLLIKYNDEMYLYNATPNVEYKAGKVEKISNQYQDYVNIDSEIKDRFELLRKIRYCISKDLYSNEEIISIVKFCEDCQKYVILKHIICEINTLLKSKNINTNLIIKEDYYDTIIIVNQINIWKKELVYLQQSDSDYPRQIELAQLITYYSDIIYNKKCVFTMLDDGYYEINKLTPRLLYDKGFAYISIKPSSFIINVEEKVEKSFSSNIYGVNYNVFGSKTALGLEPMKLFHPCGHKYIREMNGPTKNFFIKKTIEETLDIKKSIRKQLKESMLFNNIIWYDGMPIEWDPVCLNFVHSSDNYVDACMGYTVTMPEYQIMSRFNYPNPILIKEKKYE